MYVAKKLGFTITKDCIKATEPCKYPNGIPLCIVQIEVPSGKLVFGNDFRGQVSVKPDFYLNHDINLIPVNVYMRIIKQDK